MKKLTVDQIEFALKTGEFGKDVLKAQKHVAIILTQDWCPQWHSMRKYVDEILDQDSEIFYVEYNQPEANPKFMEFKEKIYKNDLIPYVRFYKNGMLTNQTNFIFKAEFLKLLRE